MNIHNDYFSVFNHSGSSTVGIVPVRREFTNRIINCVIIPENNFILPSLFYNFIFRANFTRICIPVRENLRLFYFSEINFFEKCHFTCEMKYDIEIRAVIFDCIFSSIDVKHNFRDLSI